MEDIGGLGDIGYIMKFRGIKRDIGGGKGAMFD